MPLRIGCVVEGHGEVESVPALIRRVAQELDPGLVIVIPHPVRVTKSKLLKAGEMERAAQLAALNAGENGGLFILLDSDDDCPGSTWPRSAGQSAYGAGRSAILGSTCKDGIRVVVPGFCPFIARPPGIAAGPRSAGPARRNPWSEGMVEQPHSGRRICTNRRSGFVDARSRPYSRASSGIVRQVLPGNSTPVGNAAPESVICRAYRLKCLLNANL